MVKGKKLTTFEGDVDVLMLFWWKFKVLDKWLNKWFDYQLQWI